MLWPFLILFGAAVYELMKSKTPLRFLAVPAAAAVLGVSLWQAVWLNYYHPTDARHRYVYVQTQMDYFKLIKPLEWLVQRNPMGWHIEGHILLSSYHPLPWILGDFTSIGFYEKPDNMPASMNASVIVAEADRVQTVESKLEKSYFVEPFHLRDAMDEGKLYLSYRKFAHYFPTRKPEFVPPKKNPGPVENADQPAPLEPPVAPAAESESAPETSSPVSAAPGKTAPLRRALHNNNASLATPHKP